MENKIDALSLQILEGVEARGLIGYSHTPLGEGRVLENPFKEQAPQTYPLLGIML